MHSSAEEHYVDIVEVIGSIPIAPTIPLNCDQNRKYITFLMIFPLCFFDFHDFFLNITYQINVVSFWHFFLLYFLFYKTRKSLIGHSAHLFFYVSRKFSIGQCFNAYRPSNSVIRGFLFYLKKDIDESFNCGGYEGYPCLSNGLTDGLTNGFTHNLSNILHLGGFAPHCLQPLRSLYF